MSWLEDLAGEVFSWGSKVYQAAKPVAETAWNTVKENPLATLGVLHGATQGGDLSQRAIGALKYGTVGYGADKALGTSGWFSGSPSQVAAGMTPQVGSSSSWSPTSIGNPNAFSTAVSNATPTSGAAQYFGASVGDGFSSVGGNFAQGASGAGMMDDIQSGLKKVQEFGKTYEMPIKAGMQGMAILDKRQRVKDTEAMYRDQANQEAAANAENRRITDDSNAAERAYSAMAPKNAYSNVMNATSRKVREAGLDTSQTATQSAARKRQLSLAGTAGATTAAANATYQPRLQKYDAPRNSAAIAAADYGGRADSSLWQDYAALGQTALGWDDKARKQVTG